MWHSRISQELHKRIFELTLALYRVTDLISQNEVLRKKLREKASEIFSSITEYGYYQFVMEEPLSVIAKIHTVRGYLELAKRMRFVKPINITILEREYDSWELFFKKEYEELNLPSHLPRIPSGLSAEMNGHRRNPSRGVLDQVGRWGGLSNKSVVKSDMVRDGSTSPTTPSVSMGDSGETLVESESKIDNKVLVEPEEARSGDLQGFVKYEITAEDNGCMSYKNSEKSDVRDRPIAIVDEVSERQMVILNHLKDQPRAKISDLYYLFSGISSKTIQRDLQDLVAKNMLMKEGEKRWTVYMPTS